MNQRQEILYRYLAKKKGYTSANEICSDLELYYPNGTNHDTTSQVLLRDDINTLRNDPKCRMIILSGKHGYKVAEDADEARNYLERKAIEAKSKFVTLSAQIRKLRNNDQITFDGEVVRLVDLFGDRYGRKEG